MVILVQYLVLDSRHFMGDLSDLWTHLEQENSSQKWKNSRTRSELNNLSLPIYWWTMRRTVVKNFMQSKLWCLTLEIKLGRLSMIYFCHITIFCIFNQLISMGDLVRDIRYVHFEWDFTKTGVYVALFFPLFFLHQIVYCHYSLPWYWLSVDFGRSISFWHLIVSRRDYCFNFRHKIHKYKKHHFLCSHKNLFHFTYLQECKGNFDRN